MPQVSREPQRTEKDIGYLGYRVCEPFIIGAANQTQVCWKSSKCS